jgi:predicted O-linked N-acetylglucosamine transferase (SPINDLY family)
MDAVTIDEAFAAALSQQRAGQLSAAEAGYRQILAENPNQPEVFYNLGLVLRTGGRLNEAVEAYERALELRPRFPEAINNLGVVFERLGRLDEAEDVFRHALLLEPDSSDTLSNLGGVLKDLGRLDEAVECLTRAHALDPGNARIHSNLIFTLHYSPAYDAAALHRAAAQWGEQHASGAESVQRQFSNDPDPNRRLRIGYLSSYFRDHCQALFTIPLFSNHDHHRFEIFGYSDVTAPDAITARLQGYTDGWRQTTGLNDSEAAAMIRQDKIDLLVDLTLHMADHRLGVFAEKPAPIQVTWLGYPGTTGVKAMDYRLTDPYLDPAGTDSFYTEQSIRLPESFWCYDPLTEEPPVNPLPAGAAGSITFGCLNNFCKVTDPVLDLWAQVLRSAPNSKLLLLAPVGSARTRVKARLGLVSDRVEFAAYQPRCDYLELYHRIDIGLDTFPYNGHTTSLDALWMGVPVISRTGSTVVSRAGLSLMTNLGLPELVAETNDQFVHLATSLANDRKRLVTLRSGLRERMRRSPLMDAARFAKNIEDAYRLMWQSWCQKNRD